ncbi:MAG: transglutaminase domain-containing protein [Gammaproteobacteria bacterium]
MTASRALLVAVVCIVVSLATLAWLVRTPFEMTRLRNALLIDQGVMADFNWRPGAEPTDFNLETGSAPAEFAELVNASKSNRANGYRTGLAIAQAMTRGSVTQGNPIQSDTRETLRRITQNNEGYCSDFTQVFNGLALAANVPVREWGMSFDGFSGDGHAFSEIYDDTLEKWVFLDTFNSFYVIDPATETPLSALEFRERLATNQAGLANDVRFIDDGAFGMKDAQTAIDYYRRGTSQFFLWFGNDVFAYDQNAIVKLASGAGRAVEQLTAMMVGVHPRIRVYATANSAPFLDRLKTVRALFLFAFLVGLLGASFLLYAVVALRRGRRAT